MSAFPRQLETNEGVAEFDPCAPTNHTPHGSNTTKVNQSESGTTVNPNNSRVSIPEEFDGPVSFQVGSELDPLNSMVPEEDFYEERFNRVFPE